MITECLTPQSNHRDVFSQNILFKSIVIIIIIPEGNDVLLFGKLVRKLNVNTTLIIIIKLFHFCILVIIETILFKMELTDIA